MSMKVEGHFCGDGDVIFLIFSRDSKNSSTYKFVICTSFCLHAIFNLKILKRKKRRIIVGRRWHRFLPALPFTPPYLE